jgi:hypothetical protein
VLIPVPLRYIWQCHPTQVSQDPNPDPCRRLTLGWVGQCQDLDRGQTTHCSIVCELQQSLHCSSTHCSSISRSPIVLSIFHSSYATSLHSYCSSISIDLLAPSIRSTWNSSISSRSSQGRTSRTIPDLSISPCALLCSFLWTQIPFSDSFLIVCIVWTTLG